MKSKKKYCLDDIALLEVNKKRFRRGLEQNNQILVQEIENKYTRSEPRSNIVYTYFHFYFHFKVQDSR